MSLSLPPGAPAPGSPTSRKVRFAWPLVAGLAMLCVAALLVGFGGRNQAAVGTKHADDPPVDRRKIAAPELEGGVAWLNTAGPLSLKKDLKGKVVLLDFWTLCCINCLHVFPDLAKLEKKYANELVVIGVHSPKFDNEKDTNSIRKAVLRYQLEHPVINDAEHKIWDRYDIDAWPTFVLIDPEGNLVGFTSGEGQYDLLDAVVGKVVEEAKKKKTLNEKPIRFDLAKYRESGDTPLFFPGKVTADEASQRLFIADSTHHRIVITDLNGKKIAIAGTGSPGYADGPFDEAQFDDPHGMALNGNTLYVADRKNHVIRALDLTAKTVTTVAGNGEQENDLAHRRIDKPVAAKSISLNSPWDVVVCKDRLFIAMAGHHQIWMLDLKSQEIGPYAGNGRETIMDGPFRFSSFAQPSGLTTDGKSIYVADSEGSAIRKLPVNGEGEVDTLVGSATGPGSLFVFGDKDGKGPLGAKLQHALGVVAANGKLYIADTYNSKIKIYNPKDAMLTTFAGGEEIGWFDAQPFHEPAGISYANGKLYVADTNAHRIRVVDMKTRKVTTLKLKGVAPPVPPKK